MSKGRFVVLALGAGGGQDKMFFFMYFIVFLIYFALSHGGQSHSPVQFAQSTTQTVSGEETKSAPLRGKRLLVLFLFGRLLSWRMGPSNWGMSRDGWV